MSRALLRRILNGVSTNVDFRELCALLRRLGFEEIVHGSHHKFYKEGVDDLINIQPMGAEAKPYQVKQICYILKKYGLGRNNGNNV